MKNFQIRGPLFRLLESFYRVGFQTVSSELMSGGDVDNFHYASSRRKSLQIFNTRREGSWELSPHRFLTNKQISHLAPHGGSLCRLRPVFHSLHTENINSRIVKHARIWIRYLSVTNLLLYANKCQCCLNGSAGKMSHKQV